MKWKIVAIIEFRNWKMKKLKINLVKKCRKEKKFNKINKTFKTRSKLKKLENQKNKIMQNMKSVKSKIFRISRMNKKKVWNSKMQDLKVKTTLGTNSKLMSAILKLKKIISSQTYTNRLTMESL